MNMINMYPEISFQYFVGFMVYKLVYKIGSGRIESADKVRKKKPQY